MSDNNLVTIQLYRAELEHIADMLAWAYKKDGPADGCDICEAFIEKYAGTLGKSYLKEVESKLRSRED